jgi:hypothetical protein
MILDELGIQLHDRWTRGQILTAEEQAQLDEWYQQRDAAETEKLSQAFMATGGSKLQTQIDMTLADLAVTIQRVQQVTAENEDLRKEISVLQNKLLTPKSA